MSTRGQLSQASTPYGGSGGKGYYTGKRSPTPSTPNGPGEGTPEFRDGGTQTAHSSGIRYWPPLFTWSHMRVRSAKPRLKLFTTAPSPLLPGATLDRRVEYWSKTPEMYAGHEARQRPNSAPAPFGVFAATSRSRRSTHKELSWRIYETRRRPDINSGSSLLRSRITLQQSGMDALKQIEQEVLNSSAKTARDEFADSQREAREAKQREEKEKGNQIIADNSRYLAHVPPFSLQSKLTGMTLVQSDASRF